MVVLSIKNVIYNSLNVHQPKLMIENEIDLAAALHLKMLVLLDTITTTFIPVSKCIIRFEFGLYQRDSSNIARALIIILWQIQVLQPNKHGLRRCCLKSILGNILIIVVANFFYHFERHKALVGATVWFRRRQQ